jgi:hypothetical protein
MVESVPREVIPNKKKDRRKRERGRDCGKEERNRGRKTEQRRGILDIDFTRFCCVAHFTSVRLFICLQPQSYEFVWYSFNDVELSVSDVSGQ